MQRQHPAAHSQKDDLDFIDGLKMMLVGDTLQEAAGSSPEGIAGSTPEKSTFEQASAAEKGTGDSTAGGAASRNLPGGSLQASEDMGGHLLAKHVGKTDAELMSRALTYPTTPDLASSFFNEATAETAASQAIEANAGKIAKWLADGKGTTLKIVGTVSQPVGTIVTNQGVPVASASSLFILARDATSPTGYYIFTGYPTTY